MIKVSPKFVPEIDPAFVPAVLWNREYRKLAAATADSAPLAIGLERPDGTASVFRTVCLPCTPDFAPLNKIYVERLVKFLLWARGGTKVYVSGKYANCIAEMLKKCYCKGGEREFDVGFVKQLFGEDLEILAVDEAGLPKEAASHLPLGRNLDGCRIGFDLGGSDRKCAAVIDGKVVFSEEVKWDPYFQADPEYHYEGIMHSLKLAAAHLPRVDAIGGSSAGDYINNRVGVASLFRGVKDPELFEKRVKNMFIDIAKEWGVPFEVINDGDVTALAGSMSMNKNAVLGIAMGTSVAAGYVDPEGHMTNWISELAFVPVDYRENGPADEWSGDIGCGVQYFSQQGVARLAPLAGIELPSDMPFPQRLIEVQKLMEQGDERAEKIFRSIGVAFGYTIARYYDFYPAIEKLLILGRVTSGKGGDIILQEAGDVIRKEFPEYKVEFAIPDEKNRRHGQAVAAASLPMI